MRRASFLLVLWSVGLLPMASSGAPAADVCVNQVAGTPVAVSLASEKLVQANPYYGHKRRCAAFARYALFLLTGKHFTTYGSAYQWSRHAKRLKAILPLAMLEPGDLMFFKNGRHRVNHVAVILEKQCLGSGMMAFLFQDERGVHTWTYPSNETYLHMIPTHGADPTKLESYAEIASAAIGTASGN